MAKTKALISFAVTAKLICVFVFAYAKSRFSHDEAQFILFIEKSAQKVLMIGNANSIDPDQTSID